MERTFALLVLSGLLVACGGKSASSSDTTEPSNSGTDEPTAMTETKTELAACTGTVPEGATNCLLDLGTGGDTHWSDTDGVDPGTAGCHYEFADASCSEVKPERTFGELCLDEDRLVESNPGAGECHTHGGDQGKPGVVSCSAWCESQSKAGGKCESGIEASGEHGTCQSARCVCD